jgi:DNA topoisomerase VI subunit A
MILYNSIWNQTFEVFSDADPFKISIFSIFRFATLLRVDVSEDFGFTKKTLFVLRRLAEIKSVNSSDPFLDKVEEIVLCDHCDSHFNSLTDLLVMIT